MRYTDRQLVDQIDSTWFDEHVDDFRRVHNYLKDKMWCVVGGWADEFRWGVGETLPRELTPMMVGWVRPSFIRLLHRQYVFEHNRVCMDKRHNSRIKRRWLRQWGWLKSLSLVKE